MSGTRDSMALPEGFCCGDCSFFKFCTGMGITSAGKVQCDWAPSRFVFDPAKAVVLRGRNVAAAALLQSAFHALRSYEHGNASPELAQEIADRISAWLIVEPGFSESPAGSLQSQITNIPGRPGASAQP